MVEPDKAVAGSFETDARTSPDMVPEYAANMDRIVGTASLKNRIEVELIRRNVIGRDVLDAGVGTGRAAIPLARTGYVVTGLDLSRDMLEHAQREGTGLNLRLVQGDVAALPFGNAEFDTVVSLNCLMHFPAWKAILAEWARVLRPGGRLVFDLHSLDHTLAVSRAYGVPTNELIGKDLTGPCSFARVCINDLIDRATTLGLTVEEATPYAAIIGGADPNYWFLDTVASGPFYERLLSWIGADLHLAELAYFLEVAVGALNTAATGRFMAVLVKDSDRSRTSRYVRRAQATQSALGRGDLATVAAEAGLDLAQLRANLDTHLIHPKNLTFFTILAAAAPDEFWNRIVRGLVPPRYLPEFERVRDGFSFDRAAAGFLKEIRADQVSPEAATYRGIDLVGISRYVVGHRLVAKYWERRGVA